MNQKRKIVLAAGIFPPDIGGPATYSKKIADELIENNFIVKLICYSDQKNYSDDENYNFLLKRIKRKKFWLHYIPYFIKLLLMSYKCDVIFAQGPLSSGWPALLVAKILRKKLIVKVVGDVAWEQARMNNVCNDLIQEFQNKKYNFSTNLIKKIQSLVVKKADVVVTPSKYLKKIVTDWGADENKIKVIYNAAPNINVTPKNTEEVNIISIGRLVNWKGFKALVELVPNLLKQKPNLKLYIIGDGPEKKELDSLIKGLDLEDNVILTGRLNKQEIEEYFSKTSLFVLNTAYEGLPHTVLEAMAAEVPVITTNIGGNPEVITNKKNGILVDYNNKQQLEQAILNLLNNPEQVREYIQAAKKNLTNFTWQNNIEQITLLLNE